MNLSPIFIAAKGLHFENYLGCVQVYLQAERQQDAVKAAQQSLDIMQVHLAWTAIVLES